VIIQGVDIPVKVVVYEFGVDDIRFSDEGLIAEIIELEADCS
jgi:hypothetical protein